MQEQEQDGQSAGTKEAGEWHLVPAGGLAFVWCDCQSGAHFKDNHLTTERFDKNLAALKLLHDLMDDDNASIALGAYCRWCKDEGYNGTGLIHKENCPLVIARSLIK